MSTRVGVLDVGCFSAQAVVVDLGGGSLLHPVLSHRFRLRLDRAVDASGRISREGCDLICEGVSEVWRLIGGLGVSTVVPFATSVVRDAVNADEVVRRVADRTGVEHRTLSGREEARLSYVAARHWFGWSAGPLTVLDVGGGTVELAVGDGAEPRSACSLPLGARTLTRVWEAGGDLGRKRVTGKGSDLVDVLRVSLPAEALAPAGRRAVGCSKVFQQLARLTGARAQSEGPFAGRRLNLADLAGWIPRLAALSARRRAELPGISRHRAHQSLAGAIAAHALMAATGHEVVDICPWSTREGLLLTLLERSSHPGPPA